MSKYEQEKTQHMRSSQSILSKKYYLSQDIWRQKSYSTFSDDFFQNLKKIFRNIAIAFRKVLTKLFLCVIKLF